MSGYFLFIHVNEWAPFRSADAIPISLGYILSALKREGFGGTILGDYKDSPLSPALVKELIRRSRPVAAGFSTYAENIDRVRFWARFVKHIDPGIITVLGGSQITFIPGQALEQMDEVDLFCRGDGEMVMPKLAQALQNNDGLETVPGLCFSAENGPFNSQKISLPSDLDRLASPYLDNTLEPKGKDRVILFTSRGCNGNCSFCYTPKASDYTLRLHSIERVIAELRHLLKKGIGDFWFADPNFASSAERVETLCRAMIETVPGIRFWCQARYQQLPPSLLHLLQRAGAETIAFGLESSHTATLKKINKPIIPARLAETVKLCQDLGIKVELFSLYGLPGDTFDSSLATIDFVRDNRVEIEGNSISQQLHLFYGTPMAEAPHNWGLHPLQTTRPAYLGICRDFHTQEMSSEQIECISLYWRLHRRDFHARVESGRDLFTVAGFITSNKRKINSRPLADIMLHRIYRQLDEVQAAAACLQRLQKKWPRDPEVQREVNSGLIAYRGKRRLRVERGSKIIYDCKGLKNGKVVNGTEQHYQIGIIGSGHFLPQFEEPLIGAKPGSGMQFDVTFPPDYGNKELAGKRIPFQVYIHKVMEPVRYPDVETMLAEPVHNMYRFDDLIGLKKYNESLYYMVLRDSVLHSLKGNLNDMIALFDYSLKLGLVEKALDLGHSLPKDPHLIGHIGHILQVNGYPLEALDFLEPIEGSSAEVENRRIRAYLQLKEYTRAEEVAANPLLATNLETCHLRVKMAGEGNLPIHKYLQRMDSLLDIQVKMALAG